MHPFPTVQELSSPTSVPSEGPSDRTALVITPHSPVVPFVRSSTSLTPLVCDERAISKLLDTLIQRSGLSLAEVARRLGVTTNAVRQYVAGRRTKPSLIWFVRLVELTGGRLILEVPSKK